MVARAGGVDAGMLYGHPLRCLVAAVEDLERRLEIADGQRVSALSHAIDAGERAAALSALLATERAALVRYANEVDPIKKRLAAVEEVVAAAYDMNANSVVSRRMSAALVALDQEDR